MKDRARLHLPTAALLVGVVTALLAAVALALPWQASIDIGGLYDHPYVRDFLTREYSSAFDVSFRWSRPRSALVLPGAGRVAPLTLRMHGDYPDMPIRLDTGSGEQTVLLRPGWQRILLLPQPDGWSGDIRVSIAAPPQENEYDSRTRGVVLERVLLHGNGAIPPGQAVLVGLNAALATLLAGWAFRRVWAGVLAGVALAVGSLLVLVWGGGAWRLMLTDYTGRLALVLASGGVLVWGVSTVLRWLDVRGVQTAHLRTRHLLAAAALLAFLLRYGAMAYPLNFISDIRFTMARATMVREGELLELFLPNPSLTPVQWETEATIPRSPLYYILASPLTALPGNGARLAVMAFTSAIDALAVVLVGLIILHAGGGRRAAAVGAVLAAVMPLGLESAVSWGLFPTLLAQALVVLALLVWLRVRTHLHQRWALWLFVLAVALAFVAYPTALLFLGTTWCILLVLLAVQRDKETLRTLWAGVLAGVLALLLFYGWHIPAMVSKTLPMMAERLAEHGTGSMASFTFSLSMLNPTWKPVWDKYGWTVLVAAAGGVLLLASTRMSRQAADTRTLLLAWLLTYPPMGLMSAYVVTFIIKDVLYLLPALAVLAGLFLGRVAQRRWGRVVAGAVTALVGWQGLLLVLHVIVHAFTDLK